MLVATFSLPAGAQQADKATEAATGAKIKFQEPDTYDFGEVPLGPDAFHSFAFTNAGKEPLIIQDAKPSCSCTTPEWPKQPIAPGAEGTIKVGFHALKEGPFFKEVFIQSNSELPAGEKRYVIYIKGTVKKP